MSWWGEGGGDAPGWGGPLGGPPSGGAFPRLCPVSTHHTIDDAPPSLWGQEGTKKPVRRGEPTSRLAPPRCMHTRRGRGGFASTVGAWWRRGRYCGVGGGVVVARLASSRVCVCGSQSCRVRGHARRCGSTTASHCVVGSQRPSGCGAGGALWRALQGGGVGGAAEAVATEGLPPRPAPSPARAIRSTSRLGALDGGTRFTRQLPLPVLAVGVACASASLHAWSASARRAHWGPGAPAEIDGGRPSLPFWQGPRRSRPRRHPPPPFSPPRPIPCVLCSPLSSR